MAGALRSRRYPEDRGDLKPTSLLVKPFKLKHGGSANAEDLPAQALDVPTSCFNVGQSIPYQMDSRKDLIAVHSRPEDGFDRHASSIIG